MFKTDFEKEVEDYYRAFYRKLIDKELEDLDELIDEEFQIAHVWGDVLGKEEFLKSVEEEALRFYSENIERVYIERGEDELSVRGRSLVNTSRDGGRRRIRRVQVDFKLRKVEETDEPERYDEFTINGSRWRVSDAKVSLY